MKRVEKYLLTGEIPKEIPESEDDMHIEPKSSSKDFGFSPDNPIVQQLKISTVQAIDSCVKSDQLPESFIQSCQPLENLVQIRPTHEKQKNLGDVCTNVAIVLSGKFRKQSKTPLEPKKIAELIVAHLPNDIKANISDNGFINYIAGITIKKQKDKQLPKAEKPLHQPEQPAHRLEIVTVKSSFSKEEFQLYCKYQKSIHRDKEEKLTEKSYTSTFFKKHVNSTCRIPCHIPIKGSSGHTQLTFIAH
jgi:hypothetical protein